MTYKEARRCIKKMRANLKEEYGFRDVEELLDIVLLGLNKLIYTCDNCEYCMVKNGKMVCENMKDDEGTPINVTAPDNMPCDNWKERDESK